MKSAVRFENDRLRVLELRLAPGETEAMHSHPAYLVIVLSPARMRMTSFVGGVTDMNLAEGQISFAEAVTHAGENVGTTELHEFIVELK
jgi:quercetin dioxygenase-like cupin family protein